MTSQKTQTASDGTFLRVLVTGAGGFLGRPLVERLLAEGYDVTALRRRGTSDSSMPIIVDLTDWNQAAQCLQPWRWDAVVNLAGPVPKGHTSGHDDVKVVSSHVNIALNVCGAVPRNWPGRLIHVSSMTVYGLPERLPVNESHSLKPTSAYGMAKALAEDVVFAFAQRAHLDSWVLRLPGLFSETRQTGALFRFVQAAVLGNPLIVSATEPTPWDVLHVQDAVEAIARCLSATGRCPGAINISYGRPVDLVSLAEMIATRSSQSVAVSNERGIAHPPFQMDIEKARRLLRWPPTTLDARIDEFCNSLLQESRAI